jgi:hypothetical protein
VNTEPIKTKIRLGDIRLEVYQLENGSYAATGLFRLYTTNIYRYGESWYWLGDDGIPDVTRCKFWGRREDVFLAFQGNKLCYLYLNPVDPEGLLYVPIPCNLQSAIEFCILGKLATDQAIFRLNKALDRLCLLNASAFNPSIISAGLLNNTANLLPKVDGSVPSAKKKKSSNTPKKPNPKKPSGTFNTPRIRMPIGCDGFIYLVKLDAHLKLGFTRNLDLRLTSFETASVRVELIKSIPGSLQDEKYLHSILGSKARELYDFKDEQRIIQEMVRVSYVTSVSVR